MPAEQRNSSVRTGEVDVSKDVTKQYIDDQAAGGLPNSWREAKQNAIDAPGSSTVRLQFSPQVSVITDDGDGMQLTEQRMERILTTFGETTKSREDDSTYGQFGVGFGQVLANGAVIVRTRNSVVVFDFEDEYTVEELYARVPVDDAFPDPAVPGHPLEEVSGLKYALAKTDTYHDGFTVFIHHYDWKVPDSGDRTEWDGHADDIRNRFQYVPFATPVDIEVNGDTLPDQHPIEDTDESHRLTRTRETENAHFHIKNSISGTVTVYSRGLKVCDIDGEGVEGHIVTKQNLDVNLARNDIDSGDETWQQIRDTLEEIRIEIFDEASDNRLYSDARRAMLRRMTNRPELRERWHDREVIPMANDQQTSLEEIQTRGEVAFGDSGNAYADKLIERGEVVLNADVEEVSILRDSDILDGVQTCSVDERVDESGLRDEYTVLDDADINGRQRRQLLFLRALADEIGINRSIRWGEHDSAHAWTDGETQIVFTDSFTESHKKSIWMPAARRTLVHEWTHEDDDRELKRHTRSFSDTFRERLESPTVRKAYAELVEDVEEHGFEEALRRRGYHL